jgi:hypothetical protein
MMFRRFTHSSDMEDDDDYTDDELENDSNALERQSLLNQVDAFDSPRGGSGNRETLHNRASVVGGFLGSMENSTVTAVTTTPGGGNPQDDSVERGGGGSGVGDDAAAATAATRIVRLPQSSLVALSPPHHLVESATLNDPTLPLSSSNWLRSRPSSKDGAEAAAMVLGAQQQQQQQQPLRSTNSNPLLPLQNLTISGQPAPLHHYGANTTTKATHSHHTRSRSLPGPNRYPSTDHSTTSAGSAPTSTLTASPKCVGMHCMATVLLWGAIVSLAVAIVWYSYELFNHGYVVSFAHACEENGYRKIAFSTPPHVVVSNAPCVTTDSDFVFSC